MPTFFEGCIDQATHSTFHDEEWTSKIRSKKGSSVVEVTGGCHWFMVDRPDVVNGRLDAFFAEG
ncbi:unnamed protein product [Pylaiella littoralis]